MKIRFKANSDKPKKLVVRYNAISDETISDLPDGGNAQATDYFPVVRSGANYKCTPMQNTGVQSVSEGDGSVTVAGTSQNPTVGVSEALQATIAKALTSVPIATALTIGGIKGGTGYTINPDGSLTINFPAPSYPAIGSASLAVTGSGTSSITVELKPATQTILTQVGTNTTNITTLQGQVSALQTQVATLIAQLNGTGSAIQVSAIGIGTPAGVAGSVTAKGDVIAFYGVSDD